MKKNLIIILVLAITIYTFFVIFHSKTKGRVPLEPMFLDEQEIPEYESKILPQVYDIEGKG